MSSAAAAILEQVDHLTEAECKHIYEKLGDRLHRANESDEVLSTEVKDTLDRRWEDIVSGKVQGIPHETLMKELCGQYAL